MLPVVKYTVLRLALFVGPLAALVWLGASPLLALVLAAVVSALLSYLLLRGPREELSAQIARTIARRLPGRANTGVDERAEDSLTER